MEPEFDVRYASDYGHAELHQTARFMRARGWTLVRVSVYGRQRIESAWTHPHPTY